ncbi:hypothetical protein BLA27_14085 [Brucella cytisi]|uniref:Uncharacterized protein n=1 Tax=Brucella cytisi TaxID=407152 RepID=A0A1J6HKA5_9HYPH|nr:hypothetical protein BLA27_14085 [Brucella cytisi]
MVKPDLIENIATAIEQCGWEDADILQMNDLMAKAAMKTVYDALVSHAQHTNNQDVIKWLAASPIGQANTQE